MTTYQHALYEQQAHQAWQQGRIYPHRITAALDLNNLQGPEIDQACGVKEPCVDMWEAGELYPTWTQLQALAKLCKVTTRFFTIPTPPIDVKKTSLYHHTTTQERRKIDKTPPPMTEFLPQAIQATLNQEKP